MYKPKNCSVEVRPMTNKDLSTLRSTMTGMSLHLLDTRLHLPKKDPECDLLWPICFKRKGGWCVNGYAYVEITKNPACVIHVKEYFPILWSEQLEVQLIRSVERMLAKKNIPYPVWLQVGVLTVHAVA